MDFHAIATVGQVLNSSLSALKNVRDLARDSSDHELKEKISEAYDGLLALKERLLAMDDEIRELKAQLALKTSFIGPVPPEGYIYAKEDASRDHPLCPRCYQEKGHVYPLAVQNYGGDSRRYCPNCKLIR